MESTLNRIRAISKSKKDFDQMVKFFDKVENEEELKTIIYIYIYMFLIDMHYARFDISLAEKYIRKKKQWKMC